MNMFNCMHFKFLIAGAGAQAAKATPGLAQSKACACGKSASKLSLHAPLDIIRIMQKLNMFELKRALPAK